MSVVVHEVAHGYAAYMLGDPTAKYEGRLTLNPLKHLDFFGSIILPLLLIITKAGFVIGWAKPVPYNPYNLRNQRSGEFTVAVAGIAANIALAIIFAMIVRFGIYSQVLPISFINISLQVVLINLVLAVFNLVPIPPLDGSKILFAFLPSRFSRLRLSLERYSFILVLIFVVFFWQYISPIIFYLAELLTGFSL